MKIYIGLALLFLLAACTNKKIDRSAVQDSIKTNLVKKGDATTQHQYTDTLQFIHFEGNFDYWYGVFVNAGRDTIQLVVDDAISPKFRNKLVEVKWFNDTLFEAGDNNKKYGAKRLTAIRQVAGKPYVQPVTEEKVINDVKELPEVQANADQTGIAERPTDEKEYYLVETGTHGEGNFSRLFMFRVYIYPKYEIRFYDAAGDNDISLAEWRSKNNKQ